MTMTPIRADAGRALDPARAARRLPDPRPARSTASRWSTSTRRRRSQKPPRRHRGDGRLLPRVQRERPPRDLRDRREGDRRLRGGPGQGRPVHQRARPPRDRLHPQRDRGDQPRRLLLGPPEHRPRRRDRPDRDGAPRQPRPVAAPRPGAATATSSSSRSPTTASSASTSSRCSCGSSRSSSRSPTSRTRSGTINPVREMVEMAHAAGALVLVDGAQAVPHVPVDVQALGADFYAFSRPQDARPRWAPARCGRRRELLEAMPPFLAGGEMIREVHLRRSRVQRHPLEVRGGHAGRRRRDRPRASPPTTCCDLGMDARPRARARARRLRARDAPARGPRDRAVRAAGPGPARRRRPVQPAGHPPARRRPGPGPLRGRRPGRPPLHDAAPRAPGPGGHGPGQLQRLHDHATTSTPWPPACKEVQRVFNG